MKLHVIHVDRLPRVPWWAVVIVFVWLVTVVAGVAAERFWHRNLQLCPFKRLAHLPCPTCGMTRGTLDILGGQPARALAHNPLAFIVLGIASAALIFRVLGGLSVHLELSSIQRRIAWTTGLLLLLANWAYLIRIETG